MNFFGRVAQSVGGPMVGRVRAACMSTMHITHYDVLKVELDATASDIKKAYLVSDYVKNTSSLRALLDLPQKKTSVILQPIARRATVRKTTHARWSLLPRDGR